MIKAKNQINNHYSLNKNNSIKRNMLRKSHSTEGNQATNIKKDGIGKFIINKRTFKRNR
jgi:hypothetical protein